MMESVCLFVYLQDYKNKNKKLLQNCFHQIFKVVMDQHRTDLILGMICNQYMDQDLLSLHSIAIVKVLMLGVDAW